MSAQGSIGTRPATADGIARSNCMERLLFIVSMTIVAASWKALTMSCARGSAKRNLRPDYRPLRCNLEPPLSIKKMALTLLRFLRAPWIIQRRLMWGRYTDWRVTSYVELNRKPKPIQWRCLRKPW